MSRKDKIIDVEELVGEKKPGLLKYGFLIRYLKRILHEKDVNEFVSTHQNDTPIEFCLAVMDKFNIQVDCEGLENIPKDGGAIVAMNHPWGGMDAMALVTVIHERRPDVKFIVNDLLMHLESLQPIFVGVNKLGKNAAESLKEVDKTFAGDELLCLFPAGLVSRKIKGKIVDLEWKTTFVSRAVKYQKPIIPTHINGKLSNFFYRLYSLRKALGIKANIEMLYLVNELYKQHNKKIKIKFGKPILANELDHSKNKKEWAQHIKDKVYQLKD